MATFRKPPAPTPVEMPPHLARFDADDWPDPPPSYFKPEPGHVVIGGGPWTREDKIYLYKRRCHSAAKREFGWQQEEARTGIPHGRPPGWDAAALVKPKASALLRA